MHTGSAVDSHSPIHRLTFVFCVCPPERCEEAWSLTCSSWLMFYHCLSLCKYGIPVYSFLSSFLLNLRLTGISPLILTSFSLFCILFLVLF